MVKSLKFIFLWPFLAWSCYGQNSPEESARDFLVFPVGFSNPESGLGFGAGGVYGYRTAADSLTRNSNLQLVAAYTTRQQILSYFSWEHFAPKNRQYHYGEIGYYDFSYLFYGLGNETSLADEEAFYFDLFRLQSTNYWRVRTNTYLGVRLFYDYWFIKNFDSEGLLADLSPVGINGGHSLAFGPAFLYDSRSDPFYPRQGLYAEISALGQSKFYSNFENLWLNLDLRLFETFRERWTLALNYRNSFRPGASVAFFDLPALGGFRALRGYYLGRFRGRMMQFLQTELRFPIWWKFRATAYAGAGQVWSDESDNAGPLHLAYGLGLRYRIFKTSKLNLRFDLAWGDGPMQLYFGIGEAF